MLASGTQNRGFEPGWSRRIFRANKIPSMSSFGGEVKPSVPCRTFAACKRFLRFTWTSESQAKLTGHFSPNSVLHKQRSLMSLDVKRLWRWRAELKAVHKGCVPYRPRCDGVVAPWPRPQPTLYPIVSQTFFKWGPLLSVRMFYGPHF
jgi:hypothetical protein